MSVKLQPRRGVCLCKRKVPSVRRGPRDAGSPGRSGAPPAGGGWSGLPSGERRGRGSRGSWPRPGGSQAQLAFVQGLGVAAPVSALGQGPCRGPACPWASPAWKQSGSPDPSLPPRQELCVRRRPDAAPRGSLLLGLTGILYTQAGGARPVLALPGPTAPVLVGPALKEASGLHFSSFSSEAWEKNKSENHFQN